MCTSDPVEDIYEVCSVCNGGGEASGPYFCWKCKGEGTVPKPKDDDI